MEPFTLNYVIDILYRRFSVNASICLHHPPFTLVLWSKQDDAEEVS